MTQEHRFESFFKRFSEALPHGTFALHKDLEKNMRAALNAAFTRMNLVTREEFDVQAAVSARTRLKVEELERRVAALESGRQEKSGTAPDGSIEM